MNPCVLLSCFAALVEGFSLSKDGTYSVTLSKGDTSASIAEISYDNGWKLNETQAELPAGKYCVNLQGSDGAVLSCFNYENFNAFPVTGAVVLQKNDAAAHGDESSFETVSLLQTAAPVTDSTAKGSLKLLLKDVAATPDPIVDISDAPVGNTPEEQAAAKESFKEAKKIAAKADFNSRWADHKKKKADAKGKAAAAKDDEEDKSFFQKYWMYIVPPLIMLLVNGQGQPEAQGGAPAQRQAAQ